MMVIAIATSILFAALQSLFLTIDGQSFLVIANVIDFSLTWKIVGRLFGLTFPLTVTFASFDGQSLREMMTSLARWNLNENYPKNSTLWKEVVVLHGERRHVSCHIDIELINMWSYTKPEDDSCQDILSPFNWKIFADKFSLVFRYFEGKQPLCWIEN